MRLDLHLPDGRTILENQAVTDSGRLLTCCTRCEKLFPTSYRHMGKGEMARVRNVPQCSPCRNRYPRRTEQPPLIAVVVPEKPTQVTAEPGLRVRCVNPGWALVYEGIYEVEGWSIQENDTIKLKGVDGGWFKWRFVVA